MCFSTKAKRLAISTIEFILPVHVDWFQVDNIKSNLIFNKIVLDKNKEEK